jgi:hypothetical protein
MFIEAKLVFQSYIPNEFEIGMLFKRTISMRKLKTTFKYDEIFALKDIPQDREAFILTNGFPVKPTIVSITANPDKNADVLATSDLIGWWDDGPDTDNLRDIEIKDFNYILENYDGNVDIEVKDDMFDQGIAEPVIYTGKVILTIPTVKGGEYDEEDDDWDVTSGDGLDDEEDWDDMDDITNNQPDDYDRPE